MIRRLPLLPTILVTFAVAAMIGLGIWQLGRAREKEALIAQYSAAADKPPVTWPSVPPGESLPLFRRAHGYCLQPMSKRATAGRNRSDEPGYVQIILCRTGAEGPGMPVEIGWSKDPQAQFRWSGGEVSGTIAPDRDYRMRLVADEAPPGLEPAAAPSLDSIPNNHMMYAVQWFLFAIIAAVIYFLALRKRGKQPDEAAKP